MDKGYVCQIGDFEWIPGTLRAIEALRSRGYRVVVATNQSGVGRGLYTEEQFLTLTAWMLEQVPLDAVTYCPHAPEVRCPARKPGTAMLEAVDRLLGVDRDQSFFVGDKASDIKAAERYGIRAELFDETDLFDFLQVRGLV